MSLESGIPGRPFCELELSFLSLRGLIATRDQKWQIQLRSFFGSKLTIPLIPVHKNILFFTFSPQDPELNLRAPDVPVALMPNVHMPGMTSLATRGP
jgi:hypothetical protein